MAVSREDYRIIFMGSPAFAIPTLDLLRHSGYNIVAVITSTDKLGGRGKKKLLESAVKKYALEHHIEVLQPKNLKSKDFQSRLKAYDADLQVVVAFRMLPEAIWSMPFDGTINLHGSLLPNYRGAAPIHWAVINGEIETGLTTFFIDHQIDTGAMIDWVKLPIGETDTTGSMHDKMMVLGAGLMLNTVDSIRNRNFITTFQETTGDEPKAPKLHSESCKIDVTLPLQNVYNFVRGLSPFPAAWLKIDEIRCKILAARVEFEQHNKVIGSLIWENKQLKLALADGYLIIETIQPAGKRSLKVQEWLNGYEIKTWKAT